MIFQRVFNCTFIEEMITPEYSAEYAQKLKDTYNLFKSNGGIVLFKNGISIHIAEDGFVKTVIGKAKDKSTWEMIE